MPNPCSVHVIHQHRQGVTSPKTVEQSGENKNGGQSGPFVNVQNVTQILSSCKRTLTEICCDQRSLDMALVCSLLICVNVWKCDSCEYNAAPFERPAKVRIRRLQCTPRCRVNIGIGCKVHSVNTLKWRTSCGWQYTNVRTYRRVNGVLGVRSIGTHPVSEECSGIEWAVRLGFRYLFWIRKTLLTSTSSSDQVEGQKISEY